MSESFFVINTVFIVTVIFSIFIFFKASRSLLFTAVIIAWCLVQSAVAYFGFYGNEMTVPPRMIFLVGPAFITIALFFIPGKGRAFVDRIEIKHLLLLHIVRIPVEFILNSTYEKGMLPEIMTFHGNNFDIISGLTAPVMYYFAFVKKIFGKKALIIWNFICLALLFNIMILGIFSVETPFQKFGFEQPNTAMLHFPLILLPGCVVPLVLFSHLIALRQLIKNRVTYRRNCENPEISKV